MNRSGSLRHRHRREWREARVTRKSGKKSHFQRRSRRRTYRRLRQVVSAATLTVQYRERPTLTSPIDGSRTCRQEGAVRACGFALATVKHVSFLARSARQLGPSGTDGEGSDAAGEAGNRTS